MPAPYTIEQTAKASGLSSKFIRRLKTALPELFEKHTERGQSNSLLFDEEIVEVLKRTKSLKNKGRTLQQIRDELAHVAARHEVARHSRDVPRGTTDDQSSSLQDSDDSLSSPFASPIRKPSDNLQTQSLKRENEMLHSQVSFLQEMVKRSEARFDRLLPEATASTPKKGIKSHLMMWLVEAAVVTVFAAGFIFMIWLFAQRAFSL